VFCAGEARAKHSTPYFIEKLQKKHLQVACHFLKIMRKSGSKNPKNPEEMKLHE